jgi:hypothetical protein
MLARGMEWTPRSAPRRIVALRPKAILGDLARGGGSHGGVPSRGIVGPVGSRRAFRLIPALLIDSDAGFLPMPRCIGSGGTQVVQLVNATENISGIIRAVVTRPPPSSNTAYLLAPRQQLA